MKPMVHVRRLAVGRNSNTSRICVYAFADDETSVPRRLPIWFRMMVMATAEMNPVMMGMETNSSRNPNFKKPRIMP